MTLAGPESMSIALDHAAWKAQRDMLVRLIICNTYQAYLGVIVHHSKAQEELFEQFTHPKPGDWVIEFSTIYMEQYDLTRFGKLLRIEERPAWSVETWEEEWEGYPAHERDPIPKDKFWVIEDLDGAERSWNNCSFLKVVDDRGRHWK